MRNYVQPGDGITVPAPAAIASGEIVTIGALTGIAVTDAEAGADVSLALRGVFDLPKGAEILALGDQVEESGGEVTALDAGSAIGVVVAAAASADATVRVRIG